VLPVFVGRATRGVEFFEHASKTYEAVVRLGITTDTEDMTGTVLTETEVSVTREEFEAVLPRFRGEILQVPPMYSALKVNGQKLYDLARKGREVERQPRPITIHRLELLSFDREEARIVVECSKGTYIRTLCKDIGQALGCGGCMASLRRTQAGEYTIADSIPLEKLLQESEAGLPVEHYLKKVDSMFASHPKADLNAFQERRCRNGNDFPAELPDGTYRVYGESGEFLALCKAENKVMSTIKSFFEV
jgi:tRNA pseudouridine55 synthase